VDRAKAGAVNALILVHRRQLMDQWRERLATFLALPIGHIGQYGGGKAKRTGWIDVAVIQSLQRKGAVEDFVAEYGHVIVDECHHLSAVTFERVLREVKAKYVLGLTATPTRKDGHQPIIYMQCGPIRFHLSAKKGCRVFTTRTQGFPKDY
jgi:superfamily II DNA or RNA helicase